MVQMDDVGFDLYLEIAVHLRQSSGVAERSISGREDCDCLVDDVLDKTFLDSGNSFYKNRD